MLLQHPISIPIGSTRITTVSHLQPSLPQLHHISVITASQLIHTSVKFDTHNCQNSITSLALYLHRHSRISSVIFQHLSHRYVTFLFVNFFESFNNFALKRILVKESSSSDRNEISKWFDVKEKNSNYLPEKKLLVKVETKMFQNCFQETEVRNAWLGANVQSWIEL